MVFACGLKRNPQVQTRIYRKAFVFGILYDHPPRLGLCYYYISTPNSTALLLGAKQIVPNEIFV